MFKLGVTVNCIGPAGATRMAASIPGAGIEAKEPDEFTEWNRMDPSLASPLVAWLASDKAGHVTGQVIRAVGDEIVLMNGWSNGNTIRKPEKRWEASELDRPHERRHLPQPRPRPPLLTAPLDSKRSPTCGAGRWIPVAGPASSVVVEGALERAGRDTAIRPGAPQVRQGWGASRQSG